MDQDDIPLFPVAQVTIGPVPNLGIVVIRPDFLSHATQRPQEAQHGRTYALTPVQARYVAERILSALAMLENAPPEGGGQPKH